MKALKEIREIIDPIWDITKTGEMPTMEKRVSLSVTKKAGDEGYSLCVHIDKNDTWAKNTLSPIINKYNSVISYRNTGEAQAVYPPKNITFQPHAISGKIKPGVSISHGYFRSGTLGCIVEIGEGPDSRKYATTAAHVVASNAERVNDGDPIFSPGKFSVPRLIRKHRLGKLTENTSEIFVIKRFESLEFQEFAEDEDIEMDIDIAMIKISGRRINSDIIGTFVPDPNNKGRELHIKEVVKENEIAMRLTEKCYMYGAVSGLREGILTNCLIDKRIINLPNGYNALYKDLFCVKSLNDKEQFSNFGDSGAIIYTEDRKLLGFIVGADKYLSFGCIGERCLETFKARLI